MDIRQSLNENKSVAVGVTLVMIVAAVLFVIWFNHSPDTHSFAAREFFTDDDGATWFVDDGTKLAPFDHNGKQAVLAKVYKCASGQMFVGYMEKLSDETLKTVQAARAQAPGHAGAVKLDTSGFNGIMLKKPGKGAWVRSNDPAARDMRKFTCPDGSNDYVPVAP